MTTAFKSIYALLWLFAGIIASVIILPMLAIAWMIKRLK